MTDVLPTDGDPFGESERDFTRTSAQKMGSNISLNIPTAWLRPSSTPTPILGDAHRRGGPPVPGSKVSRW